MTVEKNYRKINKDIHYFALMQIPENYFGIISMTSSDSPWVWIECYVDEDRYKVDDNYKITLRACDGSTYNHYYQDDFLSLIYEGVIVPKTSDDIHVEFVSFQQAIPNSIAYLQHDGQCLVGTFNQVKIGDKVRYQSCHFFVEVKEINEENKTAFVYWKDDEGVEHTDTIEIKELLEV